MTKTDFFYNMPGDVEYLNKDIPLKTSIEAGQSTFTSGWDHYKKNGKAEGRTYNMLKNALSPKVFIPVIVVFVAMRTGILKKFLSKLKIR